MVILETVKLWALWLWAQWQTQVLVYHILVNFVVAGAASIHTGEFVLAKLPEFLYKKILPYVMVYGAFAFAGDAIGQGVIATGVWGLITAALVGDLMDNLKRFGLPIPAALTKERLSGYLLVPESEDGGFTIDAADTSTFYTGNK